MTRLETADIFERDLGYLGKCLAGEESLMSGDDDVGHGGQPFEDIILDDRHGPVRKEQRAFFLIDVHAEISEPVAALPQGLCGCRAIVKEALVAGR